MRDRFAKALLKPNQFLIRIRKRFVVFGDTKEVFPSSNHSAFVSVRWTPFVGDGSTVRT